MTDINDYVILKRALTCRELAQLWKPIRCAGPF